MHSSKFYNNYFRHNKSFLWAPWRWWNSPPSGPLLTHQVSFQNLNVCIFFREFWSVSIKKLVVCSLCWYLLLWKKGIAFSSYTYKCYTRLHFRWRDAQIDWNGSQPIISPQKPSLLDDFLKWTTQVLVDYCYPISC